MSIPIDTTGDIVNSQRPEHCVRVVDDVDNSGSYLVYEWWPGSTGPNPDNAFDTWVEHSHLAQFFRESGWSVQWRDSR